MPFPGEIHLQLRHDRGVGDVAHAEARRNLVAGTEILARLVEQVGHRRLELTVDEGIEILAHGLVVVRADDDVGRTEARLQAGVEQIVRATGSANWVRS